MAQGVEVGKVMGKKAKQKKKPPHPAQNTVRNGNSCFSSAGSQILGVAPTKKGRLRGVEEEGNKLKKKGMENRTKKTGGHLFTKGGRNVKKQFEGVASWGKNPTRKNGRTSVKKTGGDWERKKKACVWGKIVQCPRTGTGGRVPKRGPAEGEGKKRTHKGWEEWGKKKKAEGSQNPSPLKKKGPLRSITVPKRTKSFGGP